MKNELEIMTGPERVALYEKTGGGLIDVYQDGDEWVISTLEGDERYTTIGELMEDVDYNLEETRRIYEEDNNLDEWYAMVAEVMG